VLLIKVEAFLATVGSRVDGSTWLKLWPNFTSIGGCWCFLCLVEEFHKSTKLLCSTLPGESECRIYIFLKEGGRLSVTGLEPRQGLLFELVSEYMSVVARVDSRTQESQRGHNGLSWFGPIDALCLAVDDPYT
jgi:hypothetical protein